jgi:hypothetical protein
MLPASGSAFAIDRIAMDSRTTPYLVAADEKPEVKVAAKVSSDLGDAVLDHCVVEDVGRYVLPAPEGGGMLVVTYPFMLQQTGG